MPRRLLNIASIVCLVACVTLMGMGAELSITEWASAVSLGQCPARRPENSSCTPGSPSRHKRRVLSTLHLFRLVPAFAFTIFTVTSIFRGPPQKSGRHFDFGSIQGRIVFAPDAHGPQDWRLATLNPTPYGYDPPYIDLHRGISNPFGFLLYFLGMGTVVIVPYWFLVLVSGLLGMICHLRWPLRFTLRSLFIATTFLAVVLGMIAWLDRTWIGK